MASAVWLMVLYSEGGRLTPLPSQRPSGICRDMSQWVIAAVVVSRGCPAAASAIWEYPAVMASPPTAGSPSIIRGTALLKNVNRSSKFLRAHIVNLDAFSPDSCSSEGRHGIVMAGNAIRFFAESGSGVQQTRHTLAQRCSWILDSTFCRRRNLFLTRAVPTPCAVLLEQFDLGSITFIYRQIKRRFTFGHLCIRIRAAIEQEFQGVDTLCFGCNGCHYRCSCVLRGICRVDVGAQFDPASNERRRLPGGCNVQHIGERLR